MEINPRKLELMAHNAMRILVHIMCRHHHHLPGAELLLCQSDLSRHHIRSIGNSINVTGIFPILELTYGLWDLSMEAVLSKV
ncbi:hypothetical protein E2562_033725 [Oryza meyeriana var. granulata]|uniref:Uncharacterized protein n=1 Tax=Oryza meyeriana var. granulata TaxID=110450 RepID=A0A6G1CAD0_9ORYZ|nr:hypothetical protein E2562_033725 [Oryza meyeriana var. granulata]